MVFFSSLIVVYFVVNVRLFLMLTILFDINNILFHAQIHFMIHLLVNHTVRLKYVNYFKMHISMSTIVDNVL